MQEYDQLGELIDLFVMIAWCGIKSSGDEGIEGVPSLPTKERYHAGGLDIKCERVHERLDVIRKQLDQVHRSNLNWLARNVGSN